MRPYESSLSVDVTSVAHPGNPSDESDIIGVVETNQICESLHPHKPVEGTINRVDADGVQTCIPRGSVRRDRENLGVHAGVQIKLFH